MIRIDLKRIPEGGESIAGTEPGAVLELDADPLVGVVAPVRYRLFVQYVSGELVVRGEVAVDMERACARCGEFFSTTETDSSFLRAYEISDEADSVDITEDVREAILLAMPTYPLCKAECAGRCAQCGQDLNRGPCECRPEAVDDRWGTLDGLDLDRMDGEEAAT